MTTIIRTLTVVLVVATACGQPARDQNVTKPPTGAPFIEGTIATVDPAGSTYVKEPGGGNEAVLQISDQTELYKQFGGGFEPATFEELRKGQSVAAWVTGPVAQSFPVQATADSVLITEGEPPTS